MQNRLDQLLIMEVNGVDVESQALALEGGPRLGSARPQ